MFSTIRSQHLLASLGAATVTALASLVGILGLSSLTVKLLGVTERSWPAADMCMEFWIGSLMKHRAGHRFVEGDPAAATREMAGARSLVANSLERLRRSGTLPSDTLEELARLDADLDLAVEAFRSSAENALPGAEAAGYGPPSVAGGDAGTSRAPPAIEAALPDRRIAARSLDAAIDRIEKAIAPLEESMDRSMDEAAADTVGVARQMRLYLLLVAVAGLAGAGIISTWMTSRMVRPLHRLSEMMRRLAAGQPTEPVSSSRQDEIGALSGHFDQMVADLADSRERLVASEARYRILFECARHGMVVLDEAETITEANGAFCEMVGRPVAALVHGRFHDLLPPEGREAALARLVRLVDPGLQTVDVELVRPDGSRVPSEGGGVRLADGRTVLSLRDVTERRRMEQALLQGEKLSAIGQLASGVAHEMRNPLFVISNVLYSLRETLAGQDSALAEQLEMAGEENQRVREIIDNLLEFSRPAEPGVHGIEVAAAIQQVVRLFREALRQREIELDLRLDSALRCHFHVDAFKQVMVNLVTNAMDAMPDGGRLTVTTRGSPEGRILVRVEDTGTGIAADRQNHIFVPFYSTKEPGRGTGLGLWIVHSTVARYQGRITVESAEGRGTAFTLDLSAAGKAA